MFVGPFFGDILTFRYILYTHQRISCKNLCMGHSFDRLIRDETTKSWGCEHQDVNHRSKNLVRIRLSIWLFWCRWLHVGLLTKKLSHMQLFPYVKNWIMFFVKPITMRCYQIWFFWWPVLVVEEAGVPGENHRPWANN
jgi:hypothetical protein